MAWSINHTVQNLIWPILKISEYFTPKFSNSVKSKWKEGIFFSKHLFSLKIPNLRSLNSNTAIFEPKDRFFRPKTVQPRSCTISSLLEGSTVIISFIIIISLFTICTSIHKNLGVPRSQGVSIKPLLWTCLTKTSFFETFWNCLPSKSEVPAPMTRNEKSYWKSLFHRFEIAASSKLRQWKPGITTKTNLKSAPHG